MPVVQEHEKQIAWIQVSCQRQIQRSPVQELRPTILGARSMKAAERKLRDLIAELRVQSDKARASAEFLKLKQSELRPDDWVSETMFRDTQDQLRLEQSLLVGHVHMIVESHRAKRNPLPPELRQILLEIQKQERVF